MLRMNTDAYLFHMALAYYGHTIFPTERQWKTRSEQFVWHFRMSFVNTIDLQVCLQCIEIYSAANSFGLRAFC
jgi:hypothetical protein